LSAFDFPGREQTSPPRRGEGGSGAAHIWGREQAAKGTGKKKGRKEERYLKKKRGGREIAARPSEKKSPPFVLKREKEE